MNSRQKGARGERELANYLRERGFEEARRGQQFSGSPDSPDVKGLPGLHIEAKRVERLNFYDAYAQAERDSGEGEIPTVMQRRDRGKWMAYLSLDDFLEMYKAWRQVNGGDLETNS